MSFVFCLCVSAQSGVTARMGVLADETARADELARGLMLVPINYVQTLRNHFGDFVFRRLCVFRAR